MNTHPSSARGILLAIVALSTAFVLGSWTEAPTQALDRGSASESKPVSAAPDMSVSTSSLYPEFTVEGGTRSQRDRLAQAVVRFRNAGLPLPDLTVVFASDPAWCRGFYGLYEHDARAPRITYCSEIEFVYEHELAHAWEAHSATDQQRQSFMDLRGYTVWANANVAWNESGREGAAFIIQQTIGGFDVPYILSDEFLNRSAAFTSLTGQSDHRLDGDEHAAPPDTSERAS
jgi:hypothetical protein